MKYNEFDNDERGRDALNNLGHLGGTEGFEEYASYGKSDGPVNYDKRMQNLVAAAISHAEENYKNVTMIKEIDLKSLRTWPDGDYINPEELKDMIRENGGYLDIMVDRECEDLETGEPKLNDNSPLSLRGAEYEQGELIMITATDVYTTINFNEFEHDRGLDEQDIDREW